MVTWPNTRSTTLAPTHRARTIGGIVALLVLSASCAPTSSPPDEPPGPVVDGVWRAASGESEVHENVQNEDPGARFVGALPHPLEYYRTHGGELYDLVKDRPWHGWVRNRDCAKCTPGEKTRVKIEAISNADKDPITGIPANGLVRGRVQNVGGHADAMLNIPAQNALFQKPDEYYYIITDDGNATAATLWTARITFGRYLHRPNDEVDIRRMLKKYQRCEHRGDKARLRSEADFRSCSKLLPPSMAIAWFSCDVGCCTAEGALL